jgi:hypothetical protein
MTSLTDLDPTAFQSRLEQHFHLRKWIALPNGGHALKPSRCSCETAKVLLKTDQAFDILPHVDLVTASALFVERNERIEVLNDGYHEELGGTLVTKHHQITDIPLDKAVPDILSLLAEFLFVTDSDKSRAVAAILSPAFRLGGLLPFDFPLELAEAEESQSGKTYTALHYQALRRRTRNRK